MIDFKGFVKIVLNIIFPKTCLGCGKEGNYICSECDLFISDAPNLFPGGDLVELISFWEYEGLVKKAILKAKYDYERDIIDELVEKALGTRELSLPQDMVITFVPMFKKKEKQRGFNQAKIIAEKISQMTEKKVLLLIEKRKDTKFQTELDRAGRLANVKGSFVKIGPSINSASVLLIDDVWASGATMRECARVLKRAGAKNIFGLTLARFT